MKNQTNNNDLLNNDEVKKYLHVWYEQGYSDAIETIESLERHIDYNQAKKVLKNAINYLLKVKDISNKSFENMLDK